MDITRNVDDHDIHSVLDYRALREAIVAECTHAHVNLIETLTERVAERLMADFEEIRAVRIRIQQAHGIFPTAPPSAWKSTRRADPARPRGIMTAFES